MSLVGFVQCQNGEIQQKIFVGFVVWNFTFCGFEVGFGDWNYFFGGSGGEIGKKCVTLHFDE